MDTVQFGRRSGVQFQPTIDTKALFGARAGAAAAKDENGWPALGWTRRLYLRGNVLLADLTGVPVRLATWIKE